MKTAVEWLIEELEDNGINLDLASELIKQAKEMEKEQMWKYIKINYCIGHRSLEFHRLEFEQYYNETYGGGEQ
jgi:hypothetical protein